MGIKIKFIDISDSIPERYHPIPARKNFPEWYKNLDPFSKDQRNGFDKTAKRCVPMLDSLSAGYLLLTPVDIEITQENGGLQYRWSHEPKVEFQATWQVAGHKKISEKYHAVPKFPNPWAVVTPKGYSCLYITPQNRDDLPFEIFSGIIDTDRYNQSGTLPFYLHDDSFEGLIPAGTPMAQVIPFKRQDYLMEIGTEKDILKLKKQFNELRSVFKDAYRNFYWSGKSFK